MKKTFGEKLAESVREVGVWMAENAADIAGTTPNRTRLRIVIEYEWDEMAPTIEIERGHVCEKACLALTGADDA